MKVLESKKWSLEIACRHCGSKLLVETEDVCYRTYSAWDEISEEYFFTCPECKGANVISEAWRVVPEPVRSEAQRRWRRRQERGSGGGFSSAPICGA